MIDSISIADVANYKDIPQKMKELRAVNFIFGSNGTGKTTISRVIAESENYQSCDISWKDEKPLETLVYNYDFIKNNFNEVNHLKGIFTLGEQNIERLQKIERINSEIEELDNAITSINKNLKEKNEQLEKSYMEFMEICWETKKEYDDLKDGFQGFLGSKRDFANKVLEEEKKNQAELYDLEDLKGRISLLFNEKLKNENEIPIIDFSPLIKHESNLILEKRIVGKEDIDISAMINKLKNSDWVRQGKEYFSLNNSICPFCQQSTDESFAKSLEDYFDETFTNDINEIKDIHNKYIDSTKRIKDDFEKILSNSSEFLDTEKLVKIKESFDTQTTINQESIKRKIQEVSQPCKLNSLKDIAKEITELIKNSNNKINERNQLINNKENEKKKLVVQIWKFIIKQLSSNIKKYIQEKSKLDKHISSCKLKIKEKEKEKKIKTDDRNKLEKETTNIQHTIRKINHLLKSFGFTNFSLELVDNKPFYRLIRADGKDAKSTLSEGEKSFVTFLYFYYLLEGSFSEDEVRKNCVVVIDDPISSLDADTLFIVSTLIRKLLDKISDKNDSSIKQIFILTHNVYFHKELTFKLEKNMLEDKTTFWMIFKSNNGPQLERQKSNPIKTSYQLLWYQVKKATGEEQKPDHPEFVCIQNSLRRILENYFKAWGGFDWGTICSKFEGQDLSVCNSLVSWLHDGSHSVYEDIDISTYSKPTLESYLTVFKKIFEKCGHIAHYEMMMSDVTSQESARKPASDEKR